MWLSVFLNERTGRTTYLKENNVFCPALLSLNRELAPECAAIAY
jgi:hypothetical protein